MNESPNQPAKAASTELPKPPYIEDQTWKILSEFQHPQQHLGTAQFRAGRPSAAASAPTEPPAEASPWIEIDERYDVVRNTFELVDFGKIDLSRVVLVTDAGIGKTKAVQWLCGAVNHHQPTKFAEQRKPAPRQLAFLVPWDVLEAQPHQIHDRLIEWLAGEIRNAALNQHSGCTMEETRMLVQRYRRQGNLCLLFDGLDQVGDKTGRLEDILKSSYWSSCRVVISSRPPALQTKWETLFAGRPWRFIKLEEFDKDQYKKFLGPRYDEIPVDARPILGPILGVPRVLEYLREVTDFTGIHTAADVFYRSIHNLIKRGMNNSPHARLLGWESETPPAVTHDQNVKQAWKLLGAIAFTMTCQTVREKVAAGQWKNAANFYRVDAGDFEEFEDRLRVRYQSIAKAGLGQDKKALSDLNVVLEHGVFDTDLGGLQEVQFRDRSLQEFLCAHFLAQQASDQHGDPETLSDWVYLPDHPQTEDYYHVWQYLCEMPIEGRREKNWLTAISPLYRACFQRQDGSWDARRSSEMIFRCWPRLEQYIDQGSAQADELRESWQSEFEQQWLAGKRGSEGAQAARDFVGSFLTLPEGEFQMGSPAEKQGRMPKERREFWEQFIAGAPAEPDKHPNYIQTEFIDQQTWWAPGKLGERQREDYLTFLQDVLRGRGIELLTAAFYASDETPQVREQQIGSFQLGRSPLINSWYRLFSPQHGRGDSAYNDSYAKYSPLPNCPAIFLTWFDAWAFCQWARWEGRSCRLPWENEWEYACKFGAAWDQNYWWGDDFLDEHDNLANARMSVGKTTPPSPQHVNPHTRVVDPEGIGLQDMIGDVWEWCQDRYEEKYNKNESDIYGDTHSSRVLRGGAFSGDSHDCRSACRGYWLPTNSNYDAGVRVSRARKP